MKIALVYSGMIPAVKYGGTERVIWDLAAELHRRGHEITFVVSEHSRIPFGRKIPFESVQHASELPADLDVIHFHSGIAGMGAQETPYIFTMHGNAGPGVVLPPNTVFVSQNHAERFGSDSFVHNGLNWDAYPQPDLNQKRNYFHFLGKGAWRVKNLRGAIQVVKKTPKEKLYVMGGVRFNVNMGLRFTFTPRAKFFGMVDNEEKSRMMNGSKGLVFPVLWHEPFGLAITESLYFGCPVFGTPYGSLPELVTSGTGFLSDSRKELTLALGNAGDFSKKHCHEYAGDLFNAKLMADRYLLKYEKVMRGEVLNAEAPQLRQETPKFLNWIQ